MPSQRVATFAVTAISEIFKVVATLHTTNTIPCTTYGLHSLPVSLFRNCSESWTQAVAPVTLASLLFLHQLPREGISTPVKKEMSTLGSADRYPQTVENSGLHVYDHSGIEFMQQQQHHRIEAPYHQQHDSGDTKSIQQTTQLEGRSKKRILGLPVKVFWVVAITLFVTMVGGIGGSVAGSIAANNNRGASSRVEATTVREAGDTKTVSSKLSTETSTSAAASTPSASFSKTASGKLPLVSPAPSDGCPDINGTSYVPVDSNGQEFRGQTFMVLCSTHFSAADPENRLSDIMRTYAPTLEACITLCAGYNTVYYLNMAERGFPESGLCRSVMIRKEVGGGCWLKNSTGQVNHLEKNPLISTSAILF